MRISRSNKQYARISTMSELRSTRERLEWKIEASEKALSEKYEGLREMFTLSYISSAVIRKIESARSWIATIYDGYRLAMSLFSRVESFVDKDYSAENESSSATVCDDVSDLEHKECDQTV